MLERLESAASVSDDELRRGFTSFCMELDTQMPPDPFSEEYRRSVLDLYEWLHGQPYATNHEHMVFDLEGHTQVPFPYATAGAATVGDYLMGVGHIIRTLDLAPKSRVLEFGAGWGHTTVALAQMGHQVTAIDIGPNFVELICARAAQVNVPVDAVVGDFSLVHQLDRTYDAVLFFESFHHCADHLDLLGGLDRVLAPRGRVVFAAEPIQKSMPVPWGLRLDGESLWAIRRNGWLELGFRRSYFLEALRRFGWQAERVSNGATRWGEIYVARRLRGL